MFAGFQILVRIVVIVLGASAVVCAGFALRAKGIHLRVLRLPRQILYVLALCALVATFQAGAKFRAPSGTRVVAPVVSLVNEENEETTDVASITAITVTNGVDLVLHRPATGATGVVEVAVCASTNLIADTWFALTNVAFAANVTNRPLHVTTEQLACHGVSNVCFFCFVEVGDADGDGLDNWYERHVVGTDPTLWDTDGDGFGDLAELALAQNPLASNASSADFAASPPNLPRSFSAWEIIPSSFELTRPAGLTTIVSRTFRIDRTSPWQQLFLVADVSDEDTGAGILPPCTGTPPTFQSATGLTVVPSSTKCRQVVL